ncbi:hypothetical protein NDU88_012267 [Pleurodeles waltl]|uniref:Uncharacterized protein n=1 Tax=Pleurodeles waltl TaxID=8319 RepID=A0AAV7R459_PLEWA|nr:hypothetical protein NDU88_012267 [Pleurodeles waltl]
MINIVLRKKRDGVATRACDAQREQGADGVRAGTRAEQTLCGAISPTCGARETPKHRRTYRVTCLDDG